MRLTDEQFNSLLPYEKNFETMVKHRWARNPGSSALDLMNDIYEKVTGTKNRLNKGCSNCIMRLLTELGKIFIADLEERNRLEEEKPEETPEESPEEIPETNEAKTEIFPQKEESSTPVSEIPEKPKKEKKSKKGKANETD